MTKLAVIFLIVSVCIVVVPAHGSLGILSRLKKPFQKQPQPEVVERLVVVEQPQPCKAPQCQPKPPPDYVDERPCKSKKCKPKPVYDDGPCRSNRCQTCRNECNGDERCHSECIIVDKCWNNCAGNDRCMDECGGGRALVPVFDKCSSCPPGCSNGQALLTYCEPGKWLYYVQIPKTITVNDIVSNPDLLLLYQNSNLELDSNGVSGRACLNDKTRFELTKLSATILPITNAKK